MSRKSKHIFLTCLCIVILALLVTMAFFIKSKSAVDIYINSDFKSDYNTNFNFSASEQYEISVSKNDSDEGRIYKYDIPVDSKGKPYDLTSDGAFYSEFIDYNYMIFTIKKDNLNSFKTNKHILDQLVYLDDNTGTVKVLFEVFGTDRILYGNSSTVVVYNFEKNSVRYISLKDKKVLNEQELNLKKSFYSYTMEVNRKNSKINISGNSFWSNFMIFDIKGLEEDFSIPLLNF